MPVGGQLVFKGGEPLGGVKKRKKKKSGPDDAAAPVQQENSPADESADPAKLRTVRTTAGKAAKPGAVSILSGKTYEEELSSEIRKSETGQKKNTPWGSTFVQAPKILHGYDREVTGDTAEERLDIRCAQKGDKFCR